MNNGLPATEEALLALLRSGDPAAFARLVDRYHGRLVALASTFTSSPALAEDIAQETWLAVIRGLRGFEGRSTIGTWIYGILVRRARTIAVQEARRAAPASAERNGNGLVEWSPGLGRVGLWEEPPVPWDLEDPAAIHQSHEALEVVRAALEGLPVAQRQVVLLRDVEGLGSDEVCNILELSGTNQRVLLHRGRARIRRALDNYVRDGARPPSRATAALPQGRADHGAES
ncbi:MAG TPA: sigma-70 family RNA polymerase sigma factor [Candidatus Eisenbacteria bacterium]|nr:sigma-70 family RNA polymerase sigma factor [Candidatus Eisenbacteria bacterium]